MGETDESHNGVPRGKPLMLARIIPTGVGAACVAAWLALVAGLFAGIGVDEESGLFVTALLLGVTVLTAAVAWLSSSRARVVASAAATLYVAVFVYLRFGFDRMMPDAVLYLITAAFYLSPLVAGIAAIVAGRRSDS